MGCSMRRPWRAGVMSRVQVEASKRAVKRAIIDSSSVGMTLTATGAPSAEIKVAPALLRSGSRTIPRKSSPAQIR